MKKKNVLFILKVEDYSSLSGFRFELRLDSEVIQTSFIPTDLVSLAFCLHFENDYKLSDSLLQIFKKFCLVVDDFHDFEVNNGDPFKIIVL